MSAGVKKSSISSSESTSNAKISPNIILGKLLIHLILSIITDALPSPKLNPLEGPTMLSCGKLGLEGLSQLPALKGGRGAC
jgi:hypothetical protein